MKKIKLVIAAIMICCVFLACQGMVVLAEEPSGAELSEMAMDNFLSKISEGNYVIDAEGYLKATVYSKDLVYFEYAEEMYNDFAAMSVNDEVFQAFLTDEGLEEISFVCEGKALDAAGKKLPNYWIEEDVSEGNIYNLFYNMTEEPLKFVSYDDIVKGSVASFAGYGQSAVRLMHEVYLVFDDKDPSVVHLQAEVDDDMVARLFFNDIDVVITFGNAENNAYAESWMNDPVYPEARTDWTEADEFILNSVFLPGYGLDALPFPAFASYAFMMDQENFVMTDMVNIRDPHATEEDMAAYAELLLQNGFEEVTETAEDGTAETCYRKMLREEYKCYSSVHLAYDNGINLTAEKYYDSPKYDSLDAANEVILSAGYAALPASSNLTFVSAFDDAYALTESWLYFFAYDLVLYVQMDFADQDEMLAYLEQYEEALTELGFEPHFNDNHEEEEITYLHAEEGLYSLKYDLKYDPEEVDYMESENGFGNFRYLLSDEDTVILLFKAEKYISAEEAENTVLEAGFPAINFTDPVSCRHLERFEKIQYGLDFELFLTVTQHFASVEEAEEFFDAYEAALDEAGLWRGNPANVGVNKPIAIYNEDGSMVVGIDLIDEGGSAVINYEFRVESCRN